MTPPRTSRRLQAAAVLATTCALLLAGCGGGDVDGSAGRDSAATPAPSAMASPSDVAGDDVDADDGLDADDVTGTSELGTTPQEDVFSVESPWNERVVDARVHPDSASLLESSKTRTLAGAGGVAVPPVTVEDGVHVNTRAWTTPVVSDGVPTVVTCRQVRCGDGDEDLTLDIPTGVDPDPLHDGWFTVFDADTRTAYDLWRARREKDGTISYHFMRTWDLDGLGYSTETDVQSARGSGLPLFAGLVRPGELERCEIDHALAISVPGPAAGYYISPASSTNGNNKTDTSLPEGARIRLDAGFVLERPVDTVTGRALPFDATREKHARCILQALQTYGAIVVDRAAVPTLYFQRVAPELDRSPLLHGYELSSLGLADFSVVDFTDETKHPFPAEDER